MSEFSENDEFSANISDSAIQDAIKAAAPKFGRTGYHLTIETARILGVPPSSAFLRSFWRNVRTLGYDD